MDVYAAIIIDDALIEVFDSDSITAARLIAYAREAYIATMRTTTRATLSRPMRPRLSNG
jgi:hypothetical protein